MVSNDIALEDGVRLVATRYYPNNCTGIIATLAPLELVTRKTDIQGLHEKVKRRRSWLGVKEYK